jgi:hypothetical protein
MFRTTLRSNGEPEILHISNSTGNKYVYVCNQLGSYSSHGRRLHAGMSVGISRSRGEESRRGWQQFNDAPASEYLHQMTIHAAVQRRSAVYAFPRAGRSGIEQTLCTVNHILKTVHDIQTCQSLSTTCIGRQTTAGHAHHPPKGCTFCLRPC